VTTRLWELDSRRDGRWLGNSQTRRDARRLRRWLALDLNLRVRDIKVRRAPKVAG
jgi:hypothetical protein